MIGQSQSGTGKTAAFSLTMLTRIDYGLAKPQVSRASSVLRKSNDTDLGGLLRIMAAIERPSAWHLLENSRDKSNK